LLAGQLHAHDFWLEAHPFYTAPGKTVDLSLHVGNDYVGDSLPNIASWYTDFSLYLNKGKLDIAGELGRDPAGYFTPQQTGTHTIGYQSIFKFIDMDSDTFNKYLINEGLQNALDYREQNGLQTQNGRENYIRHAKTLIQAGDSFDVDNSARVFGYELEIIPMHNPYKMHPDEILTVKILYRGKPAPDLLLVAFTRDNPQSQQRYRSNRDGLVSIALDRSGDWLLKTTKILKIDDDKADWESHWASLTFAVKTK
jgi:uncharacterized GH25 family protein